MRTNTTLVINPKGGSGKTTLATNLASYFAVNGIPATLMDYDPQGSTMNWLRVRPAHARRINGANAAPQKTGLRTLGMHVPAGTEQQRDNETELRLKARMGPELPIEQELERWFPLWGIPI